MRPEISRTLMPHFYKDLEDDVSVESMEDVRGMKKNVFFINHSSPEAGSGDTKSHKNTVEARWAVELASYLLKVCLFATGFPVTTCPFPMLIFKLTPWGYQTSVLHRRLRLPLPLPP